MVHGLAEQSGGRLTLRSVPGHGTTAEILLPVALGSAPSGARAAPRSQSDLGPAPVGLCVLVVDDDALVLMGTVAMLEDLGHLTVEAGSGAQALEILRAGRRVDVVVTDQAMPGMTGAQLAAATRAQWPGLPVILATGYAELSLGVDELVAEHLSKPFRQEELAAALAKAIAFAGAVHP
jgi:CheY-like chemotaxis protein